MSVVLAAIGNSSSARSVAECARLLADLLGAEVEEMHVEEPDTATAIAAAVRERHAIALVLGARGPTSSASPAGHVTLQLVQTLDIAVAVVPPQARPRVIKRVLVAVEGDGESHALRHLVRDLRHRPEVDLVALHVFEPEGLPMFGDEPVWETEAWTEEFGRRMLRASERDVQLEVRVGDSGEALRATATELDVDLIAIAWHRNLSRGHGRLVRSMLAKSDRPVLLLPIPRHENDS